MPKEGTKSLKSVVKSVKMEGDAVSPHIYYRKIVYDALRTLWGRAPWIASGLVGALAFASVALVLVGPHYTARAMIQFKFVREEPAKTATVATTATVDAMAILNDAAPIIHSHAVADAVVTRLALDKDPRFAHGSLLWRIFSEVRSHLGYETTGPSSRDLAAEQLIRQIKVASDPRSYLVSISVTALDPEWAAKLANAVALEYLRGQLLQQVSESYAAAEREMSDLSSVYGVHHPAYESARAKLDVLRLQLAALRDQQFDEAAATRVAGQSFVAAQKVMVPSGPNIVFVLGLTAAAALGIGSWLALQPWSNPMWRTGWPNLPWQMIGWSNLGWPSVSQRIGWPNIPWRIEWPNLSWRIGLRNMPWRVEWRSKRRRSEPAPAGAFSEAIRPDVAAAREPEGAKGHIDCQVVERQSFD